MRQEQKQFKLNVKSIDKDNSVVNQQTLTITKHKNDQKYLVISKNDFGKNFRINAGIFNKKTRFLVTEKHSLLVLNPETMEIEEKTIKEIKEKNYYLLYFIPIFLIKQNYQILLSDKIDNQKQTMFINLDFELGRAFGRKLKGQSYKDDLDTVAPNISEMQEYFLNKIISEDKINFDKRLIVSSNYKFLTGILYELYEEKLKIKNINIYLITTILNMLGASYSIRKIEDEFYVRFKLPLFFKKYLKKLKYLKNPEKNKDNIYNRKLKIIRNKKYVYDKENNEIKLVTYNEFKKYYLEAKHNLKQDKSIFDYINLGICELMPSQDFKFIPVNYGEVYDFVTEGINDATNYALPGLPLLKNSDGDILALIGIWAEDAARDAQEKFGISKRTVISELDGKPYSWIDIDAVLGLYNFTK